MLETVTRPFLIKTSKPDGVGVLTLHVYQDASITTFPSIALW